MAIDPVCKMQVDPAKAAAKVAYAGQTFYFCSEACHKAFTDEPRRYGGAAAPPSGSQHPHGR